ncbi:TonB-dependent siderophore receptor [Pseudomonas sp. LRF_L74]|uniref:TonB-dependent siderophore receptor n=1 Tax=Pseudomonas sp. LRF_L74 TaxID=3369422 RepID=UPI003F62E016
MYRQGESCGPQSAARLTPLYVALLAAWAGLSMPSAYAQTDGDAEEYENEQGDTPVLGRVLVTGEKAIVKKVPVRGGALGPRSDLQTPFSTVSVNSEKIEERQAKTIGKLFEGEAGVEAKGNTYSIQPFSLNVRGLRLDFTNGYKIDGHPFQMYGVELPLEAFETVQLLKGATGFLYGIGSPGGIVNYISKKPTDTPTLSVDVGYTQDSIFSQHVDAGGRFGDEDRFGYRLNAVQERGESYNGTHVERHVESLYLDARINPALTWRGNVLFQERNLEGGITAISVADAGARAYSGTKLPDAISGRKDLTGYDSSYYNSRAWAASTGLEWSLNDTWTLDASYSHTYKRINSRDETLHLRNAAGDYDLALRQFYQPTLQYDSTQLRLDGEFQTGWIRHQVVTGLGLQWHTRDLNQGDPSLNPDTSTGGQNHVYPNGTLPTGNLNGSSLDLAYNGYSPRKFFEISTTRENSVFFSDTLGFGDHWSLLLGLRKFDYRNENYYVSGRRRSVYEEQPTTPTVALLYSPRADTTFYASYVEALEDGGSVGTTYANSGESIAPIESKQYELGFKSNREDWALSAALFRIDRGAGYANASNVYISDGTVRYDGIEINGQYRVLPTLTVSAGGTLLRAKYLEAAEAIKGNKVEAVARVQGNLGLEKSFESIPNLRVHGSLNHSGKQYINALNSREVPAYEVVSVGASYRVPLGQGQVTYRAELDNLFDEEYWLASSNALVVGAPRTLSLNVRYDF